MAIEENRRKAYYEFLDGVRERGAVNMYGASPLLQRKFRELTKREADKILVEWTELFDERLSIK